MAINRHIEHIKSKVIENDAPKLPTASDLHEGEIAVNYAKGYETLSIKNESGDVVTFKTKEYNDSNYSSKSSEHTHSNKTALDSITGNVGTMAYQNASNYSSATEVNTALNGKANTATTLSGYNISDAKIENGTITLGNNTITPLTSVTIPVTSVTTSSTNGNISVNGSNVAVHGLGKAAYLNTGTTANTVAAGNHTHTTTIASTTDTSQVSLTYGNKFKVTAGGTDYVFTMPSSSSTWGAVTSVTTSSTNGAISVNGSNVAVHGLGGAAYLNTGTTANTVAAGNHTHSGLYEPAVVYQVITVSNNTTNVTCPSSITGGTNSGKQANVIYKNNGSTSEWTLVISTDYQWPEGSSPTIKIPKSGYAEVNFFNSGGTIYARGV